MSDANVPWRAMFPFPPPCHPRLRRHDAWFSPDAARNRHRL